LCMPRAKHNLYLPKTPSQRHNKLLAGNIGLPQGGKNG
jgi:hypothetical protein